MAVVAIYDPMRVRSLRLLRKTGIDSLNLLPRAICMTAKLTLVCSAEMGRTNYLLEVFPWE